MFEFSAEKDTENDGPKENIYEKADGAETQHQLFRVLADIRFKIIESFNFKGIADESLKLIF